MGEEMNPLQFGIMVFQVGIKECNPYREEEVALADYLTKSLQTIQIACNKGDIEAAMKELRRGSNAIFASLDGSQAWHQDCIDFARG